MTSEGTALAEETARAMRELARTVTDAPPLRLAPRPGARVPRRSWRRRWTLWAVPLTAAVAVIAIAIALVTIRDLPNGPAVPPTAPTSGSPSTAGVPKYYAMPEPLCQGCASNRLLVGRTLTGTKIAAFAPPRGTSFLAVSAAADDRTFVADTTEYPYDAETQHVTWYLLKITPGAPSPARLTRLPIPATPASAHVGTIALSPSGRELAVTYQLRQTNPMITVLRVYSVATEKVLNTWSTSDGSVALGFFAQYVQSNSYLSWVDGNRAVAFSTRSYTGNPLSPSAANVAVRILDLTSGGGGLLADSRVVWSRTFPLTATGCGVFQTIPTLTAHGKTVLCAEVTGNLGSGDGTTPWQLSWLAYATSAAAPRTLYQFTASSTGHDSWSTGRGVRWAGPSGSTVIVSWSIAAVNRPATHFGVLNAGRLIPLPTPPGVTLGGSADIAW